MNGWYQALEHLVWVTQLGFSMLFPLVCALGGCWWLTRHGVGGWVWLPGILFGLAVGAATFRSFARRWLNRAQKEQKQTPPRFNCH